mmetsp:Transcript_110683/g.344916  ORF Transcript_110683/g.344916 Transcript_110683/m.344916 type:complete len:166 (+) Transcript_110683:127-624(+)
MASSPVVLVLLALVLLLACLARMQQEMPVVMEAPSSGMITADVNSSMAANWIQVLQLKELAGMPPPRRLPSIPTTELADELRGGRAEASPARLPFAWRCCLDIAVLLVVAVRLKPWGCKATPAESTGDGQQPANPKHNVAWANTAAEPRVHACARDLLRAWDSFA